MARKKKIKRIHQEVAGKVASIYIKEHYVPKCNQVFTDGYDIIDTCYYEEIGVCVGNARRENNDWWNGDKKEYRKDNKSTGNNATFLSIIKTLENHINDFISKYNYYCIMFTGTDKRRQETYEKAIKYFCRKYNKNSTWVITDVMDGIPEYLVYIE